MTEESSVTPSEVPVPDEFTYPSVLVVRKRDPDSGEERIEIAELNGIDSLSVPTVLRIAAKIRAAQLGI